MKFLVDAQLPRRIVRHLTLLGHDALHTLDLPQQNRTSDTELRTIAMQEDRIIVTKDRDFVDAFWLLGGNWKLLLVATGNITNDKLDALLQKKLVLICSILAWASFVEFDSVQLIVHV